MPCDDPDPGSSTAPKHSIYLLISQRNTQGMCYSGEVQCSSVSGSSFRMDWLDLLAVQGTLKGLLQHHSSEASILQC